MALHWKLEDIKDFEKKCYRGNKLDAGTECLIWATMAVGFNQISEKNCEEFFKRLWLWERVVGPFRIDGGGKEIAYTLADVKAHIGLKTNASTVTKAQFFAKLWEQAGEELRRQK